MMRGPVVPSGAAGEHGVAGEEASAAPRLRQDEYANG